MTGNNLTNKHQQALTVFVYACQSAFGHTLPRRSASSKGHKAVEPEKRQLCGYSGAT